MYEIWYNSSVPKFKMYISKRIYKEYEREPYVRSNLGFKVGIAVSLKEKK